MGWHDKRENASGEMSSTLASDVGMLHGASSEVLAIFCEAAAAALWGIALGFYFCW